MSASRYLAFGAAFIACGAVLLWFLSGSADEREDVLEAEHARAENELGLMPAPDEVGEHLVLDTHEDGADEREGLAQNELAPKASAPSTEGMLERFEGKVFDALTGESLPDFQVVLEHDDQHVELTTDGEGHFAREAKLPAGKTIVRAVDRPGRRRLPPPLELQLGEANASTLDLRLPAGPTFQLAIGPPNVFDPALMDARLRYAIDDRRETSEFEPVRSGEFPWVRFGPVPEDFKSSEALELRTRDGLWTGEARVTAVHGVVPGLVRATLDARAVLTGSVSSDEGAPLEGIDVAYEGRTPAGGDVKRETRTGADGRYRFNYLLASSGNVRARSFRYAPMDLPVTLEAQRVSELNVSLVPLPPAGAIRIKVVSTSGVYTPDFRVRLNPPPEASLGGRGPNALRADSSWETVEGVKVARIEFLALPAGRYHLGVSKDDFFDWTGLEQDLTPPNDEVLVTIRDGAANAGFVVRARNGDGEALGGLRVLFEFDKFPSRLRVGTSDDILLKNVPLDARLRWRLDRNGYQPKFGDQRAFDIEEHRPEGIVHVAELDLRRGWGEMYRFQQRGSRQPLEGVKVLFDGQEVATSGSDGFALALGPKRPKLVTLQYKDWRVANGTDLRPGSRKQNSRSLTVLLQPPRNR